MRDWNALPFSEQSVAADDRRIFHAFGECQSCCRFSFVSYEAVSRASALAMVS